jgi:short-subunit dehydrogenase
MELDGSPIRMTIVHPGGVDTGMVDRQLGHEASALTFAEPLVAPEKVADAVLQAIRNGRAEILIPGGQAFFVRMLGVFPGALRMALKGAWGRGLKDMERRRATGRK